LPGALLHAWHREIDAADACCCTNIPANQRRQVGSPGRIGSFDPGLSRTNDWYIAPPKSYGPLGSLADNGSAEVLVVLQRA